MRKLYTDIDYVLHDFDKSFKAALYSLYEISIDLNKDSKYSKTSLEQYVQAYNLEESVVNEAVELASNRYFKLHPTIYFEQITNFLKKYSETWDEEIVAITSRSDRWAAEKITKSAFGKEISVLTCRSKDKSLAIDDYSIIFEDNPVSITNCLESEKDIKVIMPLYNWNEYLEKNKKYTDDLLVLDQYNIEDLEEDILEKFCKKEMVYNAF